MAGTTTSQAVRAIRSLMLAALGLMSAPVCAAAAAGIAVVPTASTLVQTSYGPVSGQLAADGATRYWLGIPYAEPPVASLRWQAPRPHTAWLEPRPANAYGNACAQVGWFYGPPAAGRSWGASNIETFGKPVGSEDCLTLNVWRPNSDDPDLPVIVFIHGGANVVGHASDPLYDGAHLAARTQAVVVTLNYRLGIFGWLSHPALEGSDALGNSGNFGLLDMIEALRFVKANATAFGGDPASVTVMGQSAGGGDIYALMGSPLAAGLFHKAIVLSALIRRGYAKEEGAEYVKNFSAQLAVKDRLAADADAAATLLAGRNDPWLSTWLRGKPAAELLELIAQQPDLREIPGFFGDGTVMPADLSVVFEQGASARVPMIVGMTDRESKLLTGLGLKMPGPERFEAMVRAADEGPETAPSLDSLVSSYLLPAWTAAPFNALHAAFSRYLRHRIDGDLDVLARHNPAVFAYRFEWNQGPEPWRTVIGACHGCDLPFVFGNFSNNILAMHYTARNRTGREMLSDRMMGSIGAFIRSGDPNHAALGVHWAPWISPSGTGQRLRFDADEREPRISMSD